MNNFKAAPLSVKPQVEKLIGAKIDVATVIGNYVTLSPDDLIQLIKLGVINPFIHWNGNPNALRMLRFYFQHPDAHMSFQGCIHCREGYFTGHIFSVTIFLQTGRNAILRKLFMRSFCDCHSFHDNGLESCSAWWD